LLYDEPGNCTNNICSYVEVGKCKFEDVRDRIYERAISKIPKMHCVIRKVLGFFFWVEVDPKLALERVKKAHCPIHTEEDLKKFCNQLLVKKFSKDELPLEIYFFEDFDTEKNTSCLVINVHHSASDASGIVSFFSSILDNQFELKLKKHVTPNKWYMSPIYFICAIFYYNYNEKRFTKIASDEDTIKVREENDPTDFKSKIFSSQEIDFTQVRKCFKTYGQRTTFNDYFMAVTSVGTKRWYNEYGHKKAHVGKMACSVNYRNLPTSYDDLHYGNYLAMIQFPFPILSDLKKALVECRKSFWDYYSDTYSRQATTFIYHLAHVPLKGIIDKGNEALEGMDFGISNIQFAEQKWKFFGQDCYRRGLWASKREQFKVFLMPITYEDKFKVQLITNWTIKMDPQKLVDHIVDVINEDMADKIKVQ
jgi:hypothetical protein